MKILLVSPLPPPSGGIATWTVRYEQYCVNHQIPLSIVNNALVGARRAKRSSKLSIADEVCRSGRIIGSLVKQIRRQKPEVIHLNSSCSRLGIYRDCLCALIGRLFSIPVILQCHCNIEDQVHGRMAQSAFKVMASKAQRILVLNRFSAEYAQKFAGSRVVIMPNFADEKDLYDRKSMSPTIKRAVFTGHVRREKGVIEIIQAAKSFPDISFLLAGPVHQEIEAMDCSDNVTLLGNQPHERVIQLLRESDIFLFPSYTEGFANALLEAMAAGLPVIATDVGANREMLGEDGGIVIPKQDVHAVEKAIREIDSNPSVRLKMSVRNTNRVREMYLRDTVLERIMDIYKEVTA